MKTCSAFFSGLLVLLLVLPGTPAHAQTGPDVAAFAPLDEEIRALMAEWDIPGMSLAVMFQGRLLFVRGYGMANVASSAPVYPYSRFRIGSNSKPITAVAILKLVEEGRLHLDASVFGDVLEHLEPFPGQNTDPRLNAITVRDLLHHAGGWDRAAIGGEPIQMTRQIAQWTGVEAPAEPETIIRYMMGQPLTFDPGTRYSYTGLSFSILGRIVEHITGMAYEAAVQELIFEEAGIYGMRIGRTLKTDAFPDEVTYYDYPGAPLATNVFTGEPNSVPWPYGGTYIEALDASGAWIASVLDLSRFMASVDGYSYRPDVLNAPTLATMVAPPPPPIAAPSANNYYGMGWSVFHDANGQKGWQHGGALPGTRSFLIRYTNGLVIAATTNSQPQDAGGFATAYNQAINRAFARTGPYPAHDLFLPQLQPAATDALTASSAGLEWRFADQAESFDVQVATDTGFNNPEVDANATEQSFLARNLASGVTYRWRVRAIRDGIADAWTPAGTFTTVRTNAAPSAPVISSPAHGSEVFVGGTPGETPLDPEATFTVMWSEATDPDGDAVSYTWQLATETAFTDLLVSQETGTATSLGFTLAELAALLDDAGLSLGSEITLHHRAIASDGQAETVGATAAITFVRGTLTDTEDEASLPAAFVLESNYPNPFTPQTWIGYALPQATDIRLTVFDLLGREVQVLVNGRTPAGRHQATFEAAGLPAGVYIYRLQAGAFSQTRRMLLVK